MAANFWKSSHCQQWLLDRQLLTQERREDLQFLTEDEYQKAMIFFANMIQALGEQLKVRQQVIATATIYFKRFYALNSLKNIDPLLMAPTCIFLASKVEEFGVISNSRLLAACQTLVKNKYAFAYAPHEFPYKIAHVLECEFFLLETLDCCLVLYHPYRPLLLYAHDLGDDERLLPLAWKVVNDSLRTDVPLLYAPYLIALAALHTACVMQRRDAKLWFAELSVDLDKVMEISRQLRALYDLWKGFDEKKEAPVILGKIPKPQLAPSTPQPGAAAS